ncbi:hypothetical protein E2C01_003854 [Portunus trituberculatus]|uniref:Secreted protein n=1 Tax=Portunus trituberculatus TaxID=210409 RepID=A0A5B7CPS0_PORTR|nr:hypothetical protein [Portunus trituberculatus]
MAGKTQLVRHVLAFLLRASVTPQATSPMEAHRCRSVGRLGIWDSTSPTWPGVIIICTSSYSRCTRQVWSTGRTSSSPCQTQ